MKFLGYALGAVEILLAMRVILRLLSANPLTPVVDLIYTVSNFVMRPFQGIFQNPVLQSGSIIDIVAITAMIGYPIIIFLIGELLRLVVKDREIPAVSQRQ